MAFLYQKKYFTSPYQFVKVFTVIACLLTAFYQVEKCTEQLIQPPITTYYGFHLNHTMRYPSVTICRRLSFKDRLFSKYGLRRNQNLMTNNFFRNFNFHRYSIENFLNDTTWDFNEIFGSFAYNGKGNSGADVDWIEFHSIRNGRCFMFTPRTTSSVFSMSGGWWFYLNHDMTTKKADSFGVSLYGFHIFIHHPNEIMTSESEQETNFLEYQYLEAAEDIRITLKYEEFERVSTKEEPCVDHDPKYSRTKCIEECFHHAIARRANCTSPWLWLLPNNTTYPQCSNFTQVSALISAFRSHNRRRLVANCTCPMSCKVTIYKPTILSRKEITDERQFPNSFIAMYYSNNIVTNMNEMVGYNINEYLSDIGGSLGFLLGLSVIGAVAVVEKILCSIIKTYFKRKNKAKEESGGENNNTIDNKNDKEMEESKLEKTTLQRNKINLYDNLRDFESDDFKCYEKTLIGKADRF